MSDPQLVSLGEEVRSLPRLGAKTPGQFEKLILDRTEIKTGLGLLRRDFGKFGDAFVELVGAVIAVVIRPGAVAFFYRARQGIENVRDG
ncbi:MAG: hypothetical protein V2I43_22420, partial [Parvularcula sp.]|nr:hypothetical protein [Parvularcula sp.]